MLTISAAILVFFNQQSREVWPLAVSLFIVVPYLDIDTCGKPAAVEQLAAPCTL
jgi:hypothetical protein